MPSKSPSRSVSSRIPLCLPFAPTNGKLRGRVGSSRRVPTSYARPGAPRTRQLPAFDHTEALEARGALLEEGGDAFLGVWRESGRRHDLDGEGIGLVLGQVDLGVEGVLAEALRPGAAPRRTRDEVVGRLVELLGRYDVVDEAPVGRRAGVDRVAGEGHLECPLAPHVASDGHERRVA